MKKYIPLFFLAAVLAAGCKSNMDYDISEGFDKEMTLFENEISVPLGSSSMVATSFCRTSSSPSNEVFIYIPHISFDYSIYSIIRKDG